MKKQLIHLLVLIGLGPARADSAPFVIHESGLSLYFDFDGPKLRSRVILPDEVALSEALPGASSHASLETAVQVFGRNKTAQNLYGGNPGNEMIFLEKEEKRTENGLLLVIKQHDQEQNLLFESHYQFYNGVPVIRRLTRVTNRGDRPVRVDYLSSALLNNFLLDKDRSTLEQLRVHWASNTWTTEAQWRADRPSNLGWFITPERLTGSASFCNRGSMSSATYLPMGMIENEKYGVTWFWQIEHSGAWYVEMAESERGNNNPYLYLGGPDERNHHAMKELAPGATYETAPVAVGAVKGGFNEAVAALTRYRRVACKKPHPADAKLPVVFNDYMNCLNGDPTTDKLMPLIDAAAAAGCEVFVIDAGWYAELGEAWWGSIGAWQPSRSRFPGGLDKVFRKIEKKGMTPGIWLEIELAGIESPLRDKPDDWFFMHNGHRVIEGSRYFLDFRNPAVIEYVTGVVDRLRRDYHIGYIKKDLNCSAPYGTDLNASSPGQGMLEHLRAHLAWLDKLHERYSDLILENCSGGGMRTDYAMLSHHQLQSSTDQTDYKKYPAIMVGSMAAVLPEQLAAWTYPLAGADARETAFNMVTALAGRIHQSGRIDQLDKTSFALVKEAIEVYKKELRPLIHECIPFFPGGLPDINDTTTPVMLGMKHPTALYYWVWRLEGEPNIVVDRCESGRVSVVYPSSAPVSAQIMNGRLVVGLAEPFSAAIVKVE